MYIRFHAKIAGERMTEEKKSGGTAEKSGEVIGKAAQKGVGIAKKFGKGLAKGFKKDDESSDEEKE